MEQQKQEGLAPDNKTTFGMIYLAANVGFWAVALFLRSGIGKRGPGFAGLGAMVAIFFYAGETHDPDMMLYLPAWIAMLIWRRITPGKGMHSEYQGRPYTTIWLVRNEIYARLAEAIGVWVLGQYLMPTAFGQFLIYASVGMGVKFLFEWVYLRRMDEAIEDAKILMQIRMSKANRR